MALMPVSAPRLSGRARSSLDKSKSDRAQESDQRHRSSFGLGQFRSVALKGPHKCAQVNAWVRRNLQKSPSPVRAKHPRLCRPFRARDSLRIPLISQGDALGWYVTAPSGLKRMRDTKTRKPR
jgi:hypothetical protein